MALALIFTSIRCLVVSSLMVNVPVFRVGRVGYCDAQTSSFGQVISLERNVMVPLTVMSFSIMIVASYASADFNSAAVDTVLAPARTAAQVLVHFL